MEVSYLIKMMIVDDEVYLRDRLKKTINWTQLGVEIVGEARNGQELIEQFSELEPDIILTDIRMPKVSGIEMLAELRKMNKRVKVIFLSGYSDFDYAREALKLDVFDYLLKPINNKKIVEVITNCMTVIAEEKEAMREAMIAYNNSCLYNQMVRDQQLISYLRGGVVDWVDIEAHFMDVSFDQYDSYM